MSPTRNAIGGKRNEWLLGSSSNQTLVTNGPHRNRLFVEGDAPLLREKGIIKEKQANTPAKRIYLALQLMYTARDPRLDVHHSDA
ncbi:MAG: flagellar biosynthesis repressor FlbT [Pseudolabrys sp.]